VNRRVVAVVVAFAVGAIGVRVVAVARWPQAVVDSGFVDQRAVADAIVEPADGVAEVRARTDGRVARVAVRVGDHVHAGDLLAEIEEDALVAEVSQRDAERRAATAQADVVREGARPEERAVTQAEVEAQRRELALAQDRATRQARLQQGGGTSDAAQAEAERGLEIARARLATVEAQLVLVRAGGRQAETRTARARADAAEAALRLARSELSRTRLVAPVSGVVLARRVDPGDTVTGSATGGPPLPLFEIADSERLEARLELEGHDASRLQPGQTVTFTPEGGGETLATATLTRLSPRMEPRTLGLGSSRVRADGSVRTAWTLIAGAAAQRLVLGERLDASIVLAHRRAEARLPRAAVQIRDGRAVVDVVWGLFVRELPVVVRAADESFVDVRGVTPGQHVLLH
jgi:multidrug resistance efflux pump